MSSPPSLRPRRLHSLRAAFPAGLRHYTAPYYTTSHLSRSLHCIQGVIHYFWGVRSVFRLVIRRENSIFFRPVSPRRTIPHHVALEPLAPRRRTIPHHTTSRLSRSPNAIAPYHTTSRLSIAALWILFGRLIRLPSLSSLTERHFSRSVCTSRPPTQHAGLPSLKAATKHTIFHHFFTIFLSHSHTILSFHHGTPSLPHANTTQHRAFTTAHRLSFTNTTPRYVAPSLHH